MQFYFLDLSFFRENRKDLKAWSRVFIKKAEGY